MTMSPDARRADEARGGRRDLVPRLPARPADAAAACVVPGAGGALPRYRGHPRYLEIAPDLPSSAHARRHGAAPIHLGHHWHREGGRDHAQNLVANCELQRVYIGACDDDIVLGVLPWFHITGMECQMNMMAYLGATLVTIGRFDLVTVLRAIERYRCTVTTLIATVNIAIVNYPKTRDFDLSSLRSCLSGGAPLPAEIARRWKALIGYQLIEGYGMSETSAPTHINPPQRPKYGTDARIVSLQDGVTELPPGHSGEIAQTRGKRQGHRGRARRLVPRRDGRL